MARLTLSLPEEFGPTASGNRRPCMDGRRPREVDGIPLIVRWLACWATGAVLRE